LQLDTHVLLDAHRMMLPPPHDAQLATHELFGQW
jgi:hypothetical protein